MARQSTRKEVHQNRKAKSYFVVFCEGESEEAYVKFLKKEFGKVAAFDYFVLSNLFEDAHRKIKKDGVLKNFIGEAREIWFFFDVEIKNKDKFDEYFKFIKKIRRDTKCPVRLLMTSGCLEYWLLLHFIKCSPTIHAEPDKEKIIRALKTKEPTYKKGDACSTEKIAKNYHKAMEYSGQIIALLEQDGLPSVDDSDNRNKWLFEKCKTFSNVHEAIAFLENI